MSGELERLLVEEESIGLLGDALRRLHDAGWWIETWYPLSDGRFECRLVDGAAGAEWGVNADPLEALHEGMSKAGLLR